MNILLSAYACEPNKGSEPGVGWSWALSYAKTHKVWVITKANNKKNIENYLQDECNSIRKNLTFIYVDLPKKLTWWKKGRRGMRLYYAMWQKKAFTIAKELEKQIDFDFVQHITFVSCTQPTYMHRLKAPFVWGPISGGENIPASINYPLSIKEMIVEKIRKLSQIISVNSSLFKEICENSKLIYAATEETKEMFPNGVREKVQILPAIGLDYIPEYVHCTNETFRIVMAGRLIYWKAFDIGIRSVIELLNEDYKVELHILGEGPKKGELCALAGDYLDKSIFFDKAVAHDDIYGYFSGFDLFLNTTLRDSGCMTMMEAAASGLPCVAIATGGPKVIGEMYGAEMIRPDSVEKMVNNLKHIILSYMSPEISEVWRSIDSMLTDNKTLSVVEALKGENANEKEN